MSGWREHVLVILLAAVLAAMAAFISARAQPLPAVSVALVLAADTSASINPDRFKVQREGYAAALADPRVLRAIRLTRVARIAVTYVEWSSANEQRVVVPWTVIESADDAEAVAAALFNAPRAFVGSTAIGAGLRFALLQLDLCPFPAERMVIDVSGDGVNNDGEPPDVARAQAEARDITVNGIAILGDDAGIEAHYRDHVVGGPGAFLMLASDYEAFAYALVGKLVREVADSQPEERP